MKQVKSIVMADDHALVRSGLKSLVEQSLKDTHIYDVGDGQQALELILTHKPNLALLDITLPTLNGLDIVDHARKSGYKGKIIMLSMHHGTDYVARAWQAGANGYVLKDAAFDELLDAIIAVDKGERYLSKDINEQTVESALEHVKSNDAGTMLTPRQRQILQLVAEGASSKEIANRLSLSLKTVEAHRSAIMMRLGIHDMAGLVKVALRLGLTDLNG